MEEKKLRGLPLSPTSLMHYVKLALRSGLFLIATGVYIMSRIHHVGTPFGGLEHIPGILSIIWILFVIEMLLLVKWEITAHRRPERFSEAHNGCLSCAGCKEKLCHHKHQLKRFLIRNKESLLLKGNSLLQRERSSLEPKRHI